MKRIILAETSGFLNAQSWRVAACAVYLIRQALDDSAFDPVGAQRKLISLLIHDTGLSGGLADTFDDHFV